MGSTTRPPSHVVVQVTCGSCFRQAELECRGLFGYLAYPAYNEYFCPACRKQNHARTPGGIVGVRVKR
ncbi:MAG TPA: hypothetical protein VLA20_11305 [Vicinamibacterales bacterium]|nr:hypothetical protein [Vicinamibacterales bacterium]